jgi:hypothetical protein
MYPGLTEVEAQLADRRNQHQPLMAETQHRRYVASDFPARDDSSPGPIAIRRVPPSPHPTASTLPARAQFIPRQTYRRRSSSGSAAIRGLPGGFCNALCASSAISVGGQRDWLRCVGEDESEQRFAFRISITKTTRPSTTKTK